MMPRTAIVIFAVILTISGFSITPGIVNAPGSDLTTNDAPSPPSAESLPSPIEPNMWVGGDYLISYDDDSNAFHPAVATSPPGCPFAGSIHVVWDEVNEVTGTREIHYSMSPASSGGREWSNDEPSEGDRIISDASPGKDGFESVAGAIAPPGTFANNPGDALDPAIAIDMYGNIHVVWRQMYTDGTWEILYSRSVDNGMTWSGHDGTGDKLVSFRRADGKDQQIQQKPAIAVSNDNSLNRAVIQVVWPGQEPTSGLQDIYYSSSDSNGETWTGASSDSAISAIGSTAFAFAPSLATSGTNGNVVCAAWQQLNPAGATNEIFFTGSSSFGAQGTWTTEDTISYAQTDGMNAGPPSIAGYGNSFIACWPQPKQTGFPADVMYSLSSDNGNSWSGRTNDFPISHPDINCPAMSPSVTLSPDGLAYAVWTERDQNPNNSTEVQASCTRTPGNPGSWSGISRDIVISHPDASGLGTPANAANASVAFAFLDGGWHPQVFWDEPNYTTGSGKINDNWEINRNPLVDSNVTVSAGWNLISVPTEQEDTAITTVLGDSNGDGATTWDRALWFDPWDAANPWKQYYSGWNASLNDLAAVNHTMAIWVNVTAVGDGVLTVTGRESSSTAISLHSGWNMIGYPAVDDSAYTVSNLKSETGATIVEGFSSTATYKTTALPDAYILKKGEGYWAYVPSATTWTVDW
ncbi:MAG: hypothetical protein HZB92_03655 [Euryarchaeota archaeon]|nr:hypothetical protein [Euryarchaeota archaeon]